MRKFMGVLQGLMEFVWRIRYELESDIVFDGRSLKAVPLPESLKDFAKKTLDPVKDQKLVELSLALLEYPDRWERLARAFGLVLENFKSAKYTDESFLECAVLLCYVSAALCSKGFGDAPVIAMESLKVACHLFERDGAFRKLGIDV